MTSLLASTDIADALVAEVMRIGRESVRNGGLPFSAIITDTSGNILGSGVNAVESDCDPTAHAEVCAIRDACARERRSDLQGTILVCSGEPCAMCYVAALFAGVAEVIYVLSAQDAAAHGYGYGRSYRLLAGFPESWPMRRWHHHVSDAHAVFSGKP